MELRLLVIAIALVGQLIANGDKFRKIINLSMSANINSFQRLDKIKSHLQCLMFCNQNKNCGIASYNEDNLLCSLYNDNLQLSSSVFVEAFKNILHIKKFEFDSGLLSSM